MVHDDRVVWKHYSRMKALLYSFFVGLIPVEIGSVCLFAGYMVTSILFFSPLYDLYSLLSSMYVCIIVTYFIDITSLFLKNLANTGLAGFCCISKLKVNIQLKVSHHCLALYLSLSSLIASLVQLYGKFLIQTTPKLCFYFLLQKLYK